MRQVRIVTAAGSTIVHPHEMVPVISGSGTIEKYAAELEPGNRVLFMGQYVKIGLDEVVGVLYSEVDGYRAARDFCFARDTGGYEVARLRMDLLYALSAMNPEAFEPGEIEKLEDLVFRRAGEDFSESTVRRLAAGLSSLLGSAGICHSMNAYTKWLKGDTIHPENLEDAVLVASLVGSPDMLERAEKIRSLAKGSNPYFKLVTIHRVVSSILSPRKGKGVGSGEAASSSARVFSEFPSWYKPVVDKLRHRVDEGIVEVPVYGVLLLEENARSESESPTPSLLHKGVAKFRDGMRDEVYSRLRMPSPEPRQVRLARGIEAMFEAYGNLLDVFVRAYLTTFLFGSMSVDPERMKLIKLLGPVSSLMIEGEPVKDYSVGDKALPLVGFLRGEEILRMPSPHIVSFASPLYGYSIEKLEAFNRDWMNFLRRFNERDFRRRYIRESRELPSEAPLSALLRATYDSSLMAQSLLTYKQFSAGISSLMRLKEAGFYEGVFGMNYSKHQTDAMVAHVSAGIYDTLGRLREIYDMNSGGFADAVGKLRDADSEIPVELAVFRSFPHVNPSVLFYSQGLAVSCAKERETEVLYRLLDTYGIDRVFFMDCFSRALSRCAVSFRNYIGHRSVEDAGSDYARAEPSRVNVETALERLVQVVTEPASEPVQAFVHGHDVNQEASVAPREAGRARAFLGKAGEYMRRVNPFK
ncbi:hypothetical protein HY640_01595 [Candidatus Woesearchaeota archaeon]|nr:hypothetical protein [Candidatus Woesearchaeota archaeon]